MVKSKSEAKILAGFNVEGLHGSKNLMIIDFIINLSLLMIKAFMDYFSNYITV